MSYWLGNFSKLNLFTWPDTTGWTAVWCLASSVDGSPSLRLSMEVAEEGGGRTRVKLRWTSGGATVDLGDQLLTCTWIVVSWSTTSLLLGARCGATSIYISSTVKAQGFLVFTETVPAQGSLSLHSFPTWLWLDRKWSLFIPDFFVNEGALRGFEGLLSW